MIATRRSGCWLRLTIAASMSCTFLMGASGAHAQPVYDFDECYWLGAPAAGFAPDYSFVDSMQPDSVLPGGQDLGANLRQR